MSSAGAPRNSFDWLSLARNAVEPIASYPQTYAQMNREASEQVAHGIEQIRQAYHPGVHDPIGFIKGLGNVGLGSYGYVSSPINAALRTIAGRPIEEISGFPKEYTEFGLSLAVPGLGLRAATPARPIVPVPKTGEPLGVNVRALTPLEEIQRMRYNHQLETLRDVDPANPTLSALDRSKWFPQSWDVRALKEEIARLKAQDTTRFSPEIQKTLSALDDSHILPKEFKPEFKFAGIDPEDYVMLMDAGWHRLLDKRPYDWQEQWRKYLNDQYKPTQEEVLKQLNAMMKQAPFVWSMP
jgi:hypothetical protein